MAAPAFASDERAEAFYRYSVKCDRATNARIEALARKEGLSPTGLVQRHFESILKAPLPAQEPSPNFDPKQFARDHDVSVTAARLWRWLKDRTNPEGLVRVKLVHMAEALGGSATTYVARYRDELISARLVVVAAHSNGPSGMTYRVLGEG